VNKYSFGIIVTVIILGVMLSGVSPISAEGEISVTRGEEISLSVYLLQNGSYGDPVTSQTIEFFDETYNSFLGASKTNREGMATLNFILDSNHPLGPMIVNATFRGNETYALAPTCQWSVLHVFSSTELQSHTSNEILSSEDELSISVRLVDDQQDPIVNEIITIRTSTKIIVASTTNTTGFASFHLICNESWSVIGDNVLFLTYDGNVSGFLEPSEEILRISIHKNPTTLRLDSSPPVAVLLNSTINLNLSAQSNENVLANAPLQIEIDNLQISEIITNEYGIAELQIRIDSDFSIGIHQITVRYSGTFRFDESYLTFQISVTTPVQFHVVVSEIIKVECNTIIGLQVYDLLHRPISEGFVNLFDMTAGIEAGSYILTSESTNNIEFTARGPNGLHDFRANITGNPFLTNQSCIFQLEVWSSTAIIISKSNILGYASPYQNVLVSFQLKDYQGPLPNRAVRILVENNTILNEITTEEKGSISILYRASNVEGLHTITIIYDGNESLYELRTTLNYNFIINKVIPARIEIVEYSVLVPTQEVYIKAEIFALNGTLLEGVQIEYQWLEFRSSTTSLAEGFVEFHLQVPLESGIHSLEYYIPNEKSLQASSGSILIALSLAEITSTEGLGIYGIIASLCISVAIISLPLLRRRYLMG
jgi:hypothetical protein